MHELSIALSIIDMATEEAERRPSERVAAVHLKLGPLSGVVQSALVSAFELAREGTPLAEASLVIEAIPVTIWCDGCNAETAPLALNELRCADCGEPAARLVHGQELEVTALELAALELEA
ncbi:MAG TPA: hydrogenase maturation nickel metallochaperone HypA [Pirellulales bacterium]|jgi:hydrogenase nickel incorporation protein HypA/HybF|nr:hydrogenase maturation nickel metallochaperone HypA [Pirellulales bacterium]